VCTPGVVTRVSNETIFIYLRRLDIIQELHTQDENRVKLGRAKKRQFLATLLHQFIALSFFCRPEVHRHEFLSPEESHTLPHTFDERFETSDRAVHREIKALVSSAHSRREIASFSIKRDHSMLIDSLDTAPELPKERIRLQDSQDSELCIN
jgi:hypothetical protein